MMLFMDMNFMTVILFEANSREWKLILGESLIMFEICYKDDNCNLIKNSEIYLIKYRFYY